MGRKKKTETGDAGRARIGKQVNVRIPDDLLEDLELIAKDFGLDLSAVIRMILTQCRGTYVKQIKEKGAKEL